MPCTSYLSWSLYDGYKRQALGIPHSGNNNNSDGGGPPWALVESVSTLANLRKRLLQLHEKLPRQVMTTIYDCSSSTSTSTSTSSTSSTGSSTGSSTNSTSSTSSTSTSSTSSTSTSKNIS